MNDKYWNMLYDHCTNISFFFVSFHFKVNATLCDCDMIICTRSLIALLKGLSQNNFCVLLLFCFFFSHAIRMMWIFVEVAVFFSLLFLLCIVYKLSGRVWARGSLNSSSSEELWIKCNATYIMRICIYIKVHAQQQ